MEYASRNDLQRECKILNSVPDALRADKRRDQSTKKVQHNSAMFPETHCVAKTIDNTSRLSVIFVSFVVSRE